MGSTQNRIQGGYKAPQDRQFERTLGVDPKIVVPTYGYQMCMNFVRSFTDLLLWIEEPRGGHVEQIFMKAHDFPNVFDLFVR